MSLRSSISFASPCQGGMGTPLFSWNAKLVALLSTIITSLNRRPYKILRSFTNTSLIFIQCCRYKRWWISVRLGSRLLIIESANCGLQVVKTITSNRLLASIRHWWVWGRILNWIQWDSPLGRGTRICFSGLFEVMWKMLSSRHRTSVFFLIYPAGFCKFTCFVSRMD